MPPSLSISQIDKLGKRLRQGEPTDEDLALLDRLRNEYLPTVREARDLILANAGIDTTFRIKGWDTIVAKLIRFQTRLSTMDDIGGLRHVSDMGLREQYALARGVQRLFPGSNINDRCTDPSHGYRALHVLAAADGFPIEIQIRTALQDRWAQVTEKMGDLWGRSLRYGGGPDEPDTLTSGGRTRSEVFSDLLSVSPYIRNLEEVERDATAVDEVAPVKSFPGATDVEGETLREYTQDLLEQVASIRDDLQSRLEAISKEVSGP